MNPENYLRVGEIITISDDESSQQQVTEEEDNNNDDRGVMSSQIIDRSGESLLTEAEGRAWFDPDDQPSSSQATELSQPDWEPRVWMEARLDRYVRRRRKYRQYITQIGITWTVEASDSEVEEPDPLVEFPVSPKRMAIADGHASPQKVEEAEDPLSLTDGEELRLSGVSEDMISLGEISLGSLEELVHKALHNENDTEPILEDTRDDVPYEQLPREIQGEIEAAFEKRRKLCFRRDVDGRSYRIRISSAGRVTVRCLPERKEGV